MWSSRNSQRINCHTSCPRIDMRMLIVFNICYTEVPFKKCGNIYFQNSQSELQVYLPHFFVKSSSTCNFQPAKSFDKTFKTLLVPEKVAVYCGLHFEGIIGPQSFKRECRAAGTFGFSQPYQSPKCLKAKALPKSRDQWTNIPIECCRSIDLNTRRYERIIVIRVILGMQTSGVYKTESL